jgi:hypothetical protein
LKIRALINMGFLVAFSFTQVACSVFGIRSEENPKYEVIAVDGDKEIRSYAPYIVAKTTIKGDFKNAQSAAFRVLAGYIFGANEKKQSITMTAPVVQSKAEKGEKLDMTAPVVQSKSDDGWQMAFMMPSKYKLEDLPTPNDKRIQFEKVPAKIMGAIRYSGRGLEATNAEKANELKSWLVANGQYEITSEPQYAGFDPPWTLPLFRKNEMLF